MGRDNDFDEMDDNESYSGRRGRGGRNASHGDSNDRGDRGSDRGGDRGKRRRGKQNIFCPKGKCFDYKDVDTLRRYVTETGKIKPRRQTGNCSRCQRELAREIKRARHIALLPFVAMTD